MPTLAGAGRRRRTPRMIPPGRTSSRRRAGTSDRACPSQRGWSRAVRPPRRAVPACGRDGSVPGRRRRTTRAQRRVRDAAPRRRCRSRLPVTFRGARTVPGPGCRPGPPGRRPWLRTRRPSRPGPRGPFRARRSGRACDHVPAPPGSPATAGSSGRIRGDSASEPRAPRWARRPHASRRCGRHPGP